MLEARVLAALFVNKIVISYPNVTELSAAPFTNLGLLNLLGMIIYNIEAVTLHTTSIKGPINELGGSGLDKGTDILSGIPLR